MDRHGNAEFRSTLSFHGRAPKPARSFAAGLVPGKQVGDFRLLAPIGQGGMGQVWQAQQVSLRREVAIKFVSPERVTEHQLELFAREARAGGRLNHPCIVAVYGHGESDGLAWIAMELVPGSWTLHDFLEEAQRLPELPADYDRRVALLLVEIAEALQAAHEARVIHRDVKPQNVLITPEDRPKLTDFGLARITDETALSATGDFAATYPYMSPEQAMAGRMGIDHRTDVFSLGVVAYELLTLRRPFEGDSAHQIAEQILTKDPADPRSIRSRIPRDLAVIVGKALEKERGRRYPSMQALAEDLRRHLSHEPIHARPPTGRERIVKWARRHPGRGLAAAAGALAVCAVSLLLAANLRANRDLQRANAELEAKTAESEARRVAAEAAAEREHRRAEEVLRLSALQDLDDLTLSADRLWPIGSAQIEAYEAWLAAADELLAELPNYQATLSELSTRMGAGGANGAPIGSDQELWWHAQLAKLIEGLRAFADPETGLSSDGIAPGHGWGVRRRLEFARTLEERSRSGAEAGARWDEARASIRDVGACPWYGGLELAPQLGLLPIGQDPGSGLWEFAHLESGEPAARGADGKLLLEDDTGVVFVLLPGGTFWMGAQRSSPGDPNFDPLAELSESPVRVTLSPFFLSKFELTQGQWRRITSQNPSLWGPSALLPVEQVNWVECDRFCRRLGLSLPSEAQWEYGARGGTDSPWWTGDDPALLVEVANLADRAFRGASARTIVFTEEWDDGMVEAAKVGRLEPNPFGLHDMHGNVWEWCLDQYEPYPSSTEPLVDPVSEGPGMGLGRVCRGGAFNLDAAEARSANRNHTAAEQSSADQGFRPARRLSP